MKVVRDDLQYERENAETILFKRYYSQACAVAALIDIQTTMPIDASRQIFRVNAKSNTPFQYYLRNVYYPLIDHLIQGIDNRFDKYGSTDYLMYGLIPSVIVERDITVKDIIEQYQDDLPMLTTQKKTFFDGKKDGSLCRKRSPIHHCLFSESLRK